MTPRRMGHLPDRRVSSWPSSLQLRERCFSSRTFFTLSHTFSLPSSLAVEDLSTPVHHYASATTASDSTCTTHVQDPSAIHKDLTGSVGATATRQQLQEVDIQELRHGIIENVTGVLLSWKKEQEDKAKKFTVFPIGGLGFMEGVVVGGLIVACAMRFSR